MSAVTILVVDDDPASRDSLHDVLVDAGYQVTAVSSGEEGLEAIKTADYDLVVTDLRMPGMDGISLLREVRKLCPQTLVILITAHASVDTAVAALREGAHDYMLKPLVYDDVITKVSRLLEQKALAWQLQHLRREVESRYATGDLVGDSKSDAAHRTHDPPGGQDELDRIDHRRERRRKRGRRARDPPLRANGTTRSSCP
jgi:DNA-binding NtrC family response regulator